METQQSPGGSSVDEDDRSVVRSLQDDSAIDSDSEDVGNESYEVCSGDSDDILTMCVSEEQMILYIFSFHHIDTLNGYIYICTTYVNLSIMSAFQMQTLEILQKSLTLRITPFSVTQGNWN